MATSADRRENLAARMGRWSAQHRKKAIWGWLAFVLLAFAIGGAVGTETQDTAQSGVGESGRAERTLDDAFPKHAGRAGARPEQQPRPRTTLASRRWSPTLSVALSAVPYTKALRQPLRAGQPRARSRPTGTRPCFASRSPATRTRPRTASARRWTPQPPSQAAHPGLHRRAVRRRERPASSSTTSISDDFKQAFVTSLPITLMILLIAFGALVAASVPIILALTAVLATIGLVGVLSHLSPVDSSINEVILLIGLAVGVDYSMFYLRREREERESGRSEEASLAAAAATSGRAVLVSGLTVMVAMAGMYLGGSADVHVVRHRDDHRRRGRGGGVADGPARAPRLARRPRREGRRPDHQGPAVERRREQHLVADPEPGRSAIPLISAAARGGRAASSSRSPRFTSIRRPRAPRRCRRT